VGEVKGGGAIAYIAPEAYAFVTKDIVGLRSAGMHVHPFLFHATQAWRLPFALLRQWAFLHRMRSKGVRCVIAHFAGHHTVLPVLLGFETHIVIAGADACSFPGIAYGSFRKPLMRRAMEFSMRRARTLLPVHLSLARFENTFSDLGPREQGYAHFVDSLRTTSIAVPYGFNASIWVDAHGDERAGAVCIAMGAANGNAIHYRKGVDLIIAAAEALPELRFTIIGALDTKSYASAPPNLTVMGRMSQPELRAMLHAHSIYLQPSVMEGFPNALCEAMLCGCLPVVSAMTSMPEIVGATGVVIKQRNSAELTSAIAKLDSLHQEQKATMRERARERILGFTEQRRTDALMRIAQGRPAEGMGE